MTTSETSDSGPGRQRFHPGLGLIGAVTAAALALMLGTDWPDTLIGIGVGFLIGGAARLFAGIWQYLAVFLAVCGGFVWLLVHYIVK